MSVSEHWFPVCQVADLVEGSGVAVLLNGQQVALFYLPNEAKTIYAIDNFDPIGRANVLSRGIVGDIGGELVVASPLYKQHFSLHTGKCLEQDQAVRVWPVRIKDEQVKLRQAAAPVKMGNAA